MNHSLISPSRRTMMFALVLLVSGTAHGQDPSQPRPDDSSVEQVLDQIEQQAIATQNQIADTIKKMRDAGDRVKKTEIGSKTQTIQKQIIGDLDVLIQAAKQQQQQQKQQQQAQRKAQEKAGQEQQRPADQKSQLQQTPDTQQPGQKQPAPDGKRQKDGQDASPTTNQGTASASELAQQKIVLQQVWGHLPERLRERVLNISADKYLPQYEGLIRRYFESLAEKRNPRGGK